MDAAAQWIDANHALLWWAAGASLLVLVATLAALPWMVGLLPADYFSNPAHRTSTTHWLWEIPKTLIGALFVLVGIVLLVLPGQGLLMIIAGLFLMSFPGKYRLERWLVTRRPVWRAMQWLRQKMGKPRMVI